MCELTVVPFPDNGVTANDALAKGIDLFDDVIVIGLKFYEEGKFTSKLILSTGVEEAGLTNWYLDQTKMSLLNGEF